jgi:hypothetical protein
MRLSFLPLLLLASIPASLALVGPPNDNHAKLIVSILTSFKKRSLRLKVVVRKNGKDETVTATETFMDEPFPTLTGLSVATTDFSTDFSTLIVLADATSTASSSTSKTQKTKATKTTKTEKNEVPKTSKTTKTEAPKTTKTSKIQKTEATKTSKTTKTEAPKTTKTSRIQKTKTTKTTKTEKIEVPKTSKTQKTDVSKTSKTSKTTKTKATISAPVGRRVRGY